MDMFSDFNSIFNASSCSRSVFNEVREVAGKYDVYSEDGADSLVHVFYSDSDADGAYNPVDLVSTEDGSLSYHWDTYRIVESESVDRKSYDKVFDVVERFCTRLDIPFMCGSYDFTGSYRSLSTERGLTREEAKQLASEIDGVLNIG